MKGLLSICIVVGLAAGAGAQQSTLRVAGPANVSLITPSGASTNTLFVQNYFSMPTSTAEQYLSVFQLKTNQSWSIVGPTGANILGVHHDFYGASTTSVWEYEFGSSTNAIVDVDCWMGQGTGAFWAWHKGTVLKSGFNLITGNGANALGGIAFKFASPEMTAIDPTFDYTTLIDSKFGTFYIPSLASTSLQGGQSAATGAAAGSGGSLAASTDVNASDLCAQITLVTGHTGTTTGTLVTYTLENLDTDLNARVARPVFSAANDAAANEIAKVSCSGTAGTVILTARAALTVDTTYKWNVLIVK